MMGEVNESDWKLFRKKLPEWQEAYMGRMVQEYAAILSGPDKSSKKFWKLEERINSDKKHVGVVARMSRSKMYHNLLALLSEGAISIEDLNDFSDDLKNMLKRLY